MKSLYRYPANSAPLPIPISKAIYIVATALPRYCGSDKSIVHAFSAGDNIPVPIPYVQAPIIKPCILLPQPIKAKDKLIIKRPTSMTLIRPCLSANLPETKRIQIEAIV